MRVATRSGALDDTCIGPYSASPQSSRMVVTGEGSLFDYSLSGRGMRIYDGGSLLVTNGATARFGTSVTVMKVDGNPGGAIRVAGADSSLELGIPGAEGEAVLSVDGGEDSLLELDGGTVKANLATRRISVYLGQNGGRFGTLRLRGGTFDTGTNGLVRVGMLGSGFLDVSGGELTGCQYIEIAERTGATGPTTNHFRQTGGYVEAFNGVYCKQAADPQRHVFVELLGGVLCAHRMAGGGGVLTPEKDHSQFYANGGVLRSTDTGCYSESGPFIYGFNSIKLGPKGLTLDIRGRSNIRQRFTDAEGEEGRLFVTGPSTYATVWFEAPDGGDNAELVLCSLPTVAIGNTMTNWQTTVVVTNGAVLDVSCVDRLSLKGLSLGNAVSSGEVRLAATNRLSLSGIVPQRAVFRMVGAFEADTDYPLIKVKGRMGAEQTLSWKGSEVCGDVPSGCSPRLGSVYCADDDMTTLVFRFEQRREPAQSNVWTGASGAEGASWTNAACWSQGVPTAESIVEFASGGAELARHRRRSGIARSVGVFVGARLRHFRRRASLLRRRRCRRVHHGCGRRPSHRRAGRSGRGYLLESCGRIVADVRRESRLLGRGAAGERRP